MRESRWMFRSARLGETRDARRETQDARKDDARMRANESARFLSTRVSTDERSFARAQRETRGES